MDDNEFIELISRLSSHDLSEEVDEWTYNYAISFIEKCELHPFSDGAKNNTIKPLDFAVGILGTIPSLFQKFTCDDESIFPELLSKEDANASAIIFLEKQLLNARLATLRLHCVSLIQNNNQEEQHQEKVRGIDTKISTLQTNLTQCEDRINQLLTQANTQSEAAQKALSNANAALTASQKTLTDSQHALTGAQNALEQAETKLKDSEHEILTHVLTLMGVFSAVITIVMSVVITSTAWLNNADGASAILAFTIPNSVAILAVASLLFLIVVYHNATTGSNNHPLKTKHTYILLIAFLVIIGILVGSLFYIAIGYTQKCAPDHTHTILTPSDYTIDDETKPDGTIVNVYFRFTFDGESYCFNYNEAFIHDGKLYFCHEHKCLE